MEEGGGEKEDQVNATEQEAALSSFSLCFSLKSKYSVRIFIGKDTSAVAACVPVVFVCLFCLSKLLSHSPESGRLGDQGVIRVGSPRRL